MGIDDEKNILRPTFARPKDAPAAEEIDRLNAEVLRRRGTGEHTSEITNLAEYQEADTMAGKIIDAAGQDPFFKKVEALQKYTVVTGYSMKDLVGILRQGDDIENYGMGFLYAAATEYQTQREEQKNTDAPL